MKKVALVTGSSRGIGKAIALQLAADGYAVAVHCIHNIEAADAVCAEITAAGGVAQAYTCDIADSCAVEAMVDSIQHQLGPVSVLINNAGIAQQKLFTEIADDEWKRMMAVHIDGAFYCSRAVLPDMIREHSGCIVNVSSMWGLVGSSCEVAYSTAKAGLIGFTKALAKELGPSGITVNAIAPGVIDTPMNSMLGEEALAALAEETPVGRIGRAEEVAKAALFLASDAASFITGEVMNITGGFVV